MSSEERVRVIQPEGWASPRGYVNGMSVTGRTVYVAGQVGWDGEQRFAHADVPGQFAQALDNVLAVVRAAGGAPSDVVKMTVYCTDLDDYRKNVRAIGAAWRERFGKHFPAMALIGVAELVDPGAKVEIEAIASLAEGTR